MGFQLVYNIHIFNAHCSLARNLGVLVIRLFCSSNTFETVDVSFSSDESAKRLFDRTFYLIGDTSSFVHRTKDVPSPS